MRTYIKILVKESLMLWIAHLRHCSLNCFQPESRRCQTRDHAMLIGQEAKDEGRKPSSPSGTPAYKQVHGGERREWLFPHPLPSSAPGRH